MKSFLAKVGGLATSPALVSVLALGVAVACAVATFVENEWGSEAAQVEVYKSWWFRFLLVLLALSLLAHLMRPSWWRLERLPMGLVHGGTVVIFVGTTLTARYGFEGIIHLREGQSASSLLSRRAYLMVGARDDQDSARVELPIHLSPRRRPRLRARLAVGAAELRVAALRYVEQAVPDIAPYPEAGPAAVLSILDGERRLLVAFRPGELIHLAGAVIACDTTVTDSLPVVTLRLQDRSPTFRATEQVDCQGMRDATLVTLPAHLEHTLQPLQLYTVGQVRFALRSYLPHARVVAIPARQVQPPVDPAFTEEALEIELQAGNQRQTLTLFGGSGASGKVQSVMIGRLNVTASFGSMSRHLPFALHLTDFSVQRYPGSERPSMFTSKVVVEDSQRGLQRAEEVFMNHPLSYRGYRFFQSSYDDDELGSVLTVAKDPGRPVVYAGFVMVGSGFILWLLWPLVRRAKDNSSGSAPGRSMVAATLGLALVAVLVSGSEQKGSAPENRHTHLRAFGSLLVLDADGRLKPMDTFAREIVQKVSGEPRVQGLAPTEVLLDMMARPEQWQRVPMIVVQDQEIRRTLGLPEGRVKARFVDFFDSEGRYRLARFVHAANQKPPAERDRHDRELLKTDERASICYMLFRGFLPRLFPHPEEPRRWLSYQEVRRELSGEVATQATELYETYLRAVRRAEGDRSWAEATRALRLVQEYQRERAGALVPGRSRVRAEILLNRLQPFQRLLPVYLAMGLVLVAVAVVTTVSTRLPTPSLMSAARGLVSAALVIHTGALAMRWYVAGHAPWSNAYESMVYIAWAAAFAGVLFSRRNLWLPATTCLLAAAALFVAHLSGMDPQITPLVPVLKSRWLVIHVSTITASYGFLGLGALVALVAMALSAFRTRRIDAHLEAVIAALISDCRRLLKVGFALLCIGTMFGAVWADVSWGRYWGWDPKETWTLITILVYVLALHIGKVPALRNRLVFAAAAVLGFGSVLMTYFGVNYYLTGLHSYAQGEPFPVPLWVYLAAGMTGAIALAAFVNDARLRRRAV
ncbi:MAG: cytochrome c biogenesis protein CcsA [candidate division KSB1 bacterium]|nr:cytochrome c biogenesis protein CcsA [candidate division KSB1 bacterium]